MGSNNSANESKWHKLTAGLKSESKLTVEKMFENQVKYSNRIRNRLFAIETKIKDIAPLAYVNINTDDRTVTIDGKFQFGDLKKISKYISKIEVILNRNKYGND